MKNLSLIGKVMFNEVKFWLKENGFTSLLALSIAGGAAFMDMWIVFGGAIGFFLGRNWEIMKNLYGKHLKEKVDDVIDDVKDKLDKKKK